jgi:hypothetical protein
LWASNSFPRSMLVIVDVMLLTSQYPLVEFECFQKTSHLANTYLQHYKLRSWVFSLGPWETHALAFQDYAWTWLSIPNFLLHWDLKVVEHCKLPSPDFYIQAQSSKGTLYSTQNYDDSSITIYGWHLKSFPIRPGSTPKLSRCNIVGQKSCSRS